MGAGLESVTRGTENRRIDDFVGAYRKKDGSIRVYLNETPGYTPKTIKAGAHVFSAGSGEPLAVQIGEDIVAARGSTDISGLNDEWEQSLIAPEQRPHFERAFEDDRLTEDGAPKSIGDEDIYEVLGVDRLSQEERIAPTAVLGQDLGSLDAYDPDNVYTWHPLSLWAAIMLSTKDEGATPTEFDILQPDWSMGLKWLFSDSIVQDIKDLIDETRDMRIDRLALGYDGKTVDLYREANKKLLHPWGFYLGLSTDGKLTVQRIKTVGIEAYDAAQQNQIKPASTEILEYKTGRKSATDAIKATLGGVGPVQGETIIASARDGTSGRTSDYQPDRVTEMDLSTVAPSRREWAFSSIISRALLQHFAIPRLRIVVDDYKGEGRDYGLGKAVQLEALNLEPEWIVDKLGDRVDDNDLDDRFFTGFLIGRKLRLGGDGSALSYEVEMLLHGDTLTRWRAPSGVVQSAVEDSGFTRITLGGDGGSDSAFGDTQKDASRFTVGDEIVIRDADGSPWTNSEVTEINNIDVSSGNNFIEVPTTFSATLPPAGKVVELAYYDSDSSGTGWDNLGLNGTFSTSLRAYVYLADDSDTLGDANESADEYGA